MNCEQAKRILEAYADGELDASGVFELERHLHDCPACAASLSNLQNLKKALRHDALLFSAPAELRRRLRAELRSQTKTGWADAIWNWKWLGAATSSIALACLAVLFAVTLTRRSTQQDLSQEVVSSYVRSSLADHAFDVASADPHTVKPWFAGKLDFSPPVMDLAAQGFPLLGGRLDYLDGRTVAALVFQRRLHFIDLFIWPASESDLQPRRSAPMRGYNVVHWSEDGMTFWAVSNMNDAELLQFAQMYASGARLPSNPR